MNRFITHFAAICLVIVGVAGCSTNPATGRTQFNALDTETEIRLGNENAPKFLAEYGGELPNDRIVSYVRNLGMRLAEASERPDLPWEFHVVDSSVINAFALPGGKVFMSRGLMVKLKSEAELAGVLGHEVGHVTAQHIGQQMTRAMGIQAAVAIIGIGASYSDSEWGQVLGAGAAVGGQGYLLKFGRDQESEADKLGLRYMTKLKYNPTAQVSVMKVLKNAMEGGGRPPEFLSTHPYPETRIKRLNQIIPKRYPKYNDPSFYVFKEDEYKRVVLDGLAAMPPAKHPSKKNSRGRSLYDAAREYYAVVEATPACDWCNSGH